MMLIYRIVHKLFSKKLLASGMEGRWNSAGKKVIYSTESIAVAFLENMIRRQGVGFNNDFKIIILEIPRKQIVSVLDVSLLKDDWREMNNYAICQSLGNAWFDAGKTLVLKVPSAVLPEGFNYVMNATHADFKLVKIVAVTDLVPDKRIEDILKNYTGN